MASQPKYRPSLTETQILHIIELAKSEQPAMSNASVSLIATLAPFSYKIANLAKTPAYVKINKPASNTLAALEDVATAGLSKSEIEEVAYNKYLANPALCSLREIKDAYEHMYITDGLMTDTEIALFERGEMSWQK